MTLVRRLLTLALAGGLMLGAALLWRARGLAPGGLGAVPSAAPSGLLPVRQNLTLEQVPSVTGRVDGGVAPAELEEVDAPPTFAVHAVDALGSRIPAGALLVHLSSKPEKIAGVQEAWRRWEGVKALGGVARGLLEYDPERVPSPEARATLSVATRYGTAWTAVDLVPPVASEVVVRLLSEECIVLRYLRSNGDLACGVPVRLEGMRDGDPSTLYSARTNELGEALLGTRHSVPELMERFDQLRIITGFTGGPAFLGAVPFTAFERCETVEFTLPPFGRVELLPTLEDPSGVSGVFLRLSRQKPLTSSHRARSWGLVGIRVGDLGESRLYEHVRLGLALTLSVGVNGVGNRDSIEFTGPGEEGETVRVDVPLDR